MDLSIILLNYNTKEITLSCLKSILKNTKGVRYEVIIVDNNSSDGSQISLGKFCSQHKAFKLMKVSKNLGFAKGNNLALKKVKGDFVLLLNSDTIVSKNAIGNMFRWMKDHPKYGIATCKLLNKDGSIQGTGGYFPNLLRVFSWMSIEDIPFVTKFIKPFHPLQSKSLFKDESVYKKFQELDWVTGAFMMINREVIDKIGDIDEKYFMYTEDTDFCFRAKKAGWKVAYLPKWSITHLGGASSNQEFPILSEYEGVKLFYKKHYPSWQYPVVRCFLKFGALWRMFLFGALNGKEAFVTYAKAFQRA